MKSAKSIWHVWKRWAAATNNRANQVNRELSRAVVAAAILADIRPAAMQAEDMQAVVNPATQVTQNRTRICRQIYQPLMQCPFNRPYYYRMGRRIYMKQQAMLPILWHILHEIIVSNNETVKC